MIFRRPLARLNHEISSLEDLIPKLQREKEKLMEDLSLVHIYFREAGIVQYSRDQYYSLIDVIGKNEM